MTIEELKGTFIHAMHGNGAYKGLRQTNTLEALMYWYKKGIKVFEVDIAKTSDDRYVALAHDMSDKSLQRLDITNLPKERTYDWFMSQKLFSITTRGLTPLSLENVISFIKNKSDVIVMLDLFGLFTFEESKHFTCHLNSIIDDCNIKDRLLLEVYNNEMMEGILSECNGNHIIYCIRHEGNLERERTISYKELEKKSISIISYPWMYTNQFKGELEEYARNGFTIFSRTKYNNRNQQLKLNGVNVNIVDYKFDGIRALYQLPLYYIATVKRLIAKMVVKLLSNRRRTL